MIFLFNDQVYQPVSMILMFDLVPMAHVEKINLKQDVEMNTQHRGIGIGEKYALTPRGMVRGKRTWTIDIEMRLGAYLDWAANYYALKGQALVGGTRPTIGVMTILPNDGSEVERAARSQVFQFEFCIKSEDGHGGDASSTEGIIISLSGECTDEPRQMYGGRPVSGIF